MNKLLSVLVVSLLAVSMLLVSCATEPKEGEEKKVVDKSGAVVGKVYWSGEYDGWQMDAQSGGVEVQPGGHGAEGREPIPVPVPGETRGLTGGVGGPTENELGVITDGSGLVMLGSNPSSAASSKCTYYTLGCVDGNGNSYSIYCRQCENGEDDCVCP